MGNFGINTSPAGVDATRAPYSKLNFSSKYPLAKMDRTNTISFQNINITFLNDTPNPASGSSNSTLIHSFPHTYKYIPSFWMMGSKVGGYVNTPYIQNENAWLVLVSVGTFATLRVAADSTNVYIYVDKTVTGADPNPSVSSISLSLRLYVFVEDLLGT